MTWKEMNVTQSERAGGQVFSFEAIANLEAPGVTPDILVPDIVKNVVVTVDPEDGASVAIYSTTDPVANVKAESEVTWLIWHLGYITIPAASSFFPVSAIRMTQVGSGKSKITVRAQ